MIALDLAARRVVMASMAYYGLDESLLSDGEFDELCRFCADNWKDLSPERKFALGSPDKIRTSGFHVRVSTQAEHGCAQWLMKQGRYPQHLIIQPTMQQRFSKVIGHWRPCNAYLWGPRDHSSRCLPASD
ncbi:hypothetical protein EDE09_124101 [Neorhizobium sp. S3-V5DH]|nr:hypothetical protein EDE09_124101 [Neorhizobium sp. S3-V5DH]